MAKKVIYEGGFESSEGVRVRMTVHGDEPKGIMEKVDQRRAVDGAKGMLKEMELKARLRKLKSDKKSD